MHNERWTAQTECVNKSWLHNSNNRWTVTSCTSSGGTVFLIHSGGYIYRDNVGNAKAIYSASPVLFLKSTVKISSGAGSSTDPFILTN